MRGGISSLLLGCHCLIRGGVRSQAGGAEALRIGSKLTLFPLNTCSPLCQHWHPCHRGEQCWSKRGPCRLQACEQSGAAAGQPRDAGGLRCAACAGVIRTAAPALSESPCSPQQPAPTTTGLWWSHAAGQLGPRQLLERTGHGLWWSGCRQRSGPPWCTARVNTSFGCPCPCR